MDYGHELEFGVFLSPDASGIDQVLQNAQLAEVSGLDLVTLQDHPYQAAHGDTWTLLTAIGARTTSIRLAPNVISLPLRPPLGLAKAAATLDLITGGRVDLGLGAGAFWDAIVAAGGPRRTPKEAVDALIEAIALLRDAWAGGRVDLDGEHYRAKGYKAGPRPAHDIPIVLGAYGPRMLRVVGRLADGWVPSLGYVEPPALPEMNERIDAAARKAGRDPAQIRRWLNIFGNGMGGEASAAGRPAALADYDKATFLRGEAAVWVEQLAGLALEAGVSTLILGTDDPQLIARFGTEIAPAVRDLVAAERERGALVESPLRSAATGASHPADAGAASEATTAPVPASTAPPFRTTGRCGPPRTTGGAAATRTPGTRRRGRHTTGAPRGSAPGTRPPRNTSSTSTTICVANWTQSATSSTRSAPGTSAWVPRAPRSTR